MRVNEHQIKSEIESSLNCPIEKDNCNKCDFNQRIGCLCPEGMTKEEYVKLRKDYTEYEKEVFTSERFVRFISRFREIEKYSH